MVNEANSASAKVVCVPFTTKYFFISGTTYTTTELREFTLRRNNKGNSISGGYFVQAIGYSMHVGHHRWSRWSEIPVGRRVRRAKFLKNCFGDTCVEITTKAGFHKARNLFEKALPHQMGKDIYKASSKKEDAISFFTKLK